MSSSQKCLIGWICCTTANKNWKQMGKKNGKYCNRNLPGERLNNNLFSFYLWLHYFHYNIQSWCRFWRRHFLNAEGTHYVFSQPGNSPETFFLVLHYWLTKFTNVNNNLKIYPCFCRINQKEHDFPLANLTNQKTDLLSRI